jgi:hypothetical protein
MSIYRLLEDLFSNRQQQRAQILTDFFSSIDSNITFLLRYNRIMNFSVPFITNVLIK